MLMQVFANTRRGGGFFIEWHLTMIRHAGRQSLTEAVTAAYIL